MYELASEFINTKVSREEKKTSSLPTNTLKFFTFARNNVITNEVLDFFAGIPPQRTDDENYEEYRERRIFQKALYKFRPLFYIYP